MALECAPVAVILAVNAAKSGGDGWESNPPRTPQQRPANGFEDRGAVVLDRPLESANVRSTISTLRDCLATSALIQWLGCLLGCQ